MKLPQAVRDLLTAIVARPWVPRDLRERAAEALVLRKTRKLTEEREGSHR